MTVPPDPEDAPVADPAAGTPPAAARPAVDPSAGDPVAAAPDAITACARCGGETIAGVLALPLLGRAKFAYRLGTQSIETDVDARMCATCGTVAFVVGDPSRIIHAAKADRAARRAMLGTDRRLRGR